MNYGKESDLGLYVGFYRLEEYAPFFPRSVSITTKMMVAAKYRRSNLAVRLAKACYASASSFGIRFDFMDCNPHLKPVFERLGYRQVMDNAFHPEYGEVHPMVHAVYDRDFMEQIGSPFAPLARELKIANDDSVTFFYKRFCPAGVSAHRKLCGWPSILENT